MKNQSIRAIKHSTQEVSYVLTYDANKNDEARHKILSGLGEWGLQRRGKEAKQETEARAELRYHLLDSSSRYRGERTLKPRFSLNKYQLLTGRTIRRKSRRPFSNTKMARNWFSKKKFGVAAIIGITATGVTISNPCLTPPKHE